MSMPAKKRIGCSDYHAGRQRKSHKKSRSGCANCRFRRVKCDEGKPTCQKCQSYMVPCSYDRSTEDLQLWGETVSIDLGVPCKANSSYDCSMSLTPPLKYSPIVPLSIDPTHDIILRFQRRTALTLGTEHTKHLYAEFVPRLAMQHEHLLHAILATTILHDQALAGASRATTRVSYHLSHAASLLNQKLSATIINEDRDALWATAVYLCAMAVFNVDTSDPEATWPLSPSHTTDLEWLNMQAGLKVIWNLAQVDRGGGTFSVSDTNPKVNCVYPGPTKSGITGIPQILVDLCGFTHNSTASNNPYHAAVQHLICLLPVEGSPANVLSFMVFAGGMTKEFRKLLYEKDPRALLILAIWYSKLFHSAWWMSPRARIECQAIFRYVGRLDVQNPTFKVVLEMVGEACARLDSHTALMLLDGADTGRQPRQRSLKLEQPPNAPTSEIVDMFWISV